MENSHSTWKQIFNKNVGRYVQTIIAELANQNSDYAINDSASSLLNLIKTINTKKYPEIKDSEIPFRIPTNWVWCRLGEICTKIGSGSTPNGSNYSDQGIAFFRSQNIHNEGLVYDDINFISTEIHQKMKGTTVYPNDILLNITGGSLGRCALVPVEFFEGNVSQHVCIIRPISVNNAFYHKIILSPFFQQFIFSSTTGSGREGLPKYNLEQFLIPLPTIQEQNNIVEFLNDFEIENLKSVGSYFNANVEQKIIDLHNSQLVNSDLSNELTEQLTLVKKLRQQLLQDAVQGRLVSQDSSDEPGSELLKKIKAEKAKDKKYKELPAIRLDEIPFDIPDNWVWCKLGSICSKVGSGSTPNGSNYSKDGIPFFRSQNIHDSGLVYDDIKFISSEVHNEMRGTITYANDILLNITGGSMGRCAIVPNHFHEGNVSQHVCIIRPILVDNRFYHKVILSPFFQALIFSSTTGAGREGLPKYNLEQFLIPLPPLAEQRRILAKLVELMQICDDLEITIHQSKCQNELLLQ